jgi:hypothetical protein
MEAHLARIDAVNGYVGAITVTLRESALAAAARKRPLLRGGRSDGLFTAEP